MNLFGLGKKPVSAELAGRNLTALMIDADDCWRDVCALRAYKTTGPIATCEVAFARAALTKWLLCDGIPEPIADRASRAADNLILESFSGEDTDETLKFYDKALSSAAPERVAMYSRMPWYHADLASRLGVELGVPGIPSVEAVFIFEQVDVRVRRLTSKMKLI